MVLGVAGEPHPWSHRQFRGYIQTGSAPRYRQSPCHAEQGSSLMPVISVPSCNLGGDLVVCVLKTVLDAGVAALDAEAARLALRWVVWQRRWHLLLAMWVASGGVAGGPVVVMASVVGVAWSRSGGLARVAAAHPCSHIMCGICNVSNELAIIGYVSKNYLI